MSGKTGSRSTRRKPTTVRRQSAKTDGAFGKENAERVEGNGRNRNLDKAVGKKTTTGGAGGA